jgi:hypothetical protein
MTVMEMDSSSMSCNLMSGAGCTRFKEQSTNGIGRWTCPGGPLTDQLTLPLRHGGLGLARTVPVEGDTAYLAAAATTQVAMQRGLAAFRPLHEPSSEQLQRLWDTLHDTAVGLWPQTPFTAFGAPPWLHRPRCARRS